MKTKLETPKREWIFTPFPEESNGYINIETEKGTISYYGTVITAENRDETILFAENTAKLIANAPDMLTVLQEIMDCYKKHGQLLKFDVNKVREVLEKM
jgi:hypothetical protein